MSRRPAALIARVVQRVGLMAMTAGLLLVSSVKAAPTPTPWAYDLPAQWSEQTERGAQVLKPPGQDGAHVALMLLPAQPLEGELNTQFARLKKAAATVLALGDEREVSSTREGQDTFGPFMIWSGSFAPAAPATGRLWLTVMARSVGGKFAGVIFAADSPQHVGAWLPASVRVFNSLRIATGIEGAGAAAGSVSSGGASPTAVPAGIGRASLPALVGTWSGNTTRRINNTNFGHGGLTLKIARDGRYEYLHESIFPACTVVRTASGSLAIEGGLLVMHPEKDHELRVRHKPDPLCVAGDTDLPLQPRRFKYEVRAVNFNGQASYQLAIWADTEPSQALMRLEPRPQDAAMARPAALAAATSPPANWMLGAWRAVSLPTPSWQLDQRASLTPYRADLVFLDGGRYRLQVHRPDVLDSPVCTKSVDLDEEGDALQTLSSPNAARVRVGSMVLVPRQSRLTEQVQRCGTDTRTTTQELSHAPRYLYLRQIEDRTDKLELGCNLSYETGRTEYPMWSYLSCANTADILSNGYQRP
jgi:hypothetical protein